MTHCLKGHKETTITKKLVLCPCKVRKVGPNSKQSIQGRIFLPRTTIGTSGTWVFLTKEELKEMGL